MTDDGPKQVPGPNDMGVKVAEVFYPLDLSKLSLGEQAEISRMTDMGMVRFADELERGDDMDGRVVLAIVWLAIHRKNPLETAATVGELDFDQVELVFPSGGGDEERPPAEPSPASSPSAPARADSGETNGQPSLEPGGVPGLAG